MQVNLSDSEWKLMNRLWEQSPRTIMELTASLKEDTCLLYTSGLAPRR